MQNCITFLIVFMEEATKNQNGVDRQMRCDKTLNVDTMAFSVTLYEPSEQTEVRLS